MKSTDKGNVTRTESTNFLVSVYHQDNYSYQGRIQWLDTGKIVNFRSELELILLIQQALSSKQDKQQEFRKWNDVPNITAM